MTELVPAQNESEQSFDELHQKKSLKERIKEVVPHFLSLGFLAFGGPSAHVGMLHHRFVEQHKWLTDRDFSELFAMANGLPGPASTQLAFSIALCHNGLIPALVAFLLWSMPGFIIMTSLAIGVAFVPADVPSWAAHLQNGMVSVAVGLVGLAAYKLGMKLVETHLDVVLAWIAGSGVIVYSASWLEITLMAFGGTVKASYTKLSEYIGARRQKVMAKDIELSPETSEKTEPTVSTDSLNNKPTQTDFPFIPQTRTGVIALSCWLILLIILFIVRGFNVLDSSPRGIQILFSFYIAGSVIFGGGPVVVPLLYTYMVSTGWLSDREFLLGVAIINIVPGPNFNFAAYCGGLALGAPRNTPSGEADVGRVIGGALLGYLGIFVPGLVVKCGILPLWNKVRKYPMVKVFLSGVSSSAVGLVYGAVYLLWTRAITMEDVTKPPQSIETYPFFVIITAASFLGVGSLSIPPWLMIIIASIAAIIRWAIIK